MRFFGDARPLLILAVTASSALALLVLCLNVTACEPDDGAHDAGAPEDPVAFPADFEAHYREMRDCRHSHEHELRFIRVFASESAQASYAALSPEAPYPAGATLVKPEYDDEACSVLLGYTAMQKLEADAGAGGGDWRWQKLSAERELLEDGAPERCVQCHSQHCAPPYGYDLTCAEEL